jgi:dihydrolipoamide dehydrogenase
MTEKFQIVIVGAGPGGYVAALKAAQLGARVGIVEKHHFGGTCLNYGCIPSKALLSSAELVHQIQNAASWGVKVGGEVTFDWPAIQKRKDKVIAQLRGGIGALLKGRKVTAFQGVGKLNGHGRILVTAASGETQEVEAEKVILAPGSMPTKVPGWPEDAKYVCTSDEAVHWADLPRRLLIVGGGVIGCEFACMCRALGVEVTVVEMLGGLLPGLDKDLGVGLERVFKKRGITTYVDTKVTEMLLAGGTVTAGLSNGTRIEVDRVLVATGRKPNTKELGLETVGIETSPRGFIKVDEYMRTTVPGYYCVGDANGRCLLAHAASAQGVAAVEDALGCGKAFTAPIPSAVYTFPEIGAVGMTEAEAKEKGLPISVGKFPLSALGKTMATNHTEGFVKVLRHRETDELLGVHMMGHNATECIAAAGALMHTRAKVEEFAEVVFAHPTVGEALKEAAEDALGMGLHVMPRKVMRVMIGDVN